MDILKTIGEAAVLEQLAEECNELAHAALKMARAIRGENPTPVTLAEARENASEEVTDVLLCLELLGKAEQLNYSPTLAKKKMERWENRIREAKVTKQLNIVHCKECVHCDNGICVNGKYDSFVQPDWFCSQGERG